MPLAPGSPEVVRIDAAMAEWRQGDLALEEGWFVHAAPGASPQTADSEQAGEEPQALITEVAGLCGRARGGKPSAGGRSRPRHDGREIRRGCVDADTRLPD